MFISILYMFRTAMYPSSGELIVSVRHLVYVTLYRWPFGVQVWMKLREQSHPNLYRNKHTQKKIVRQVGYLQGLYRDARSTNKQTKK
jgi:hypothetical protein